MICIGTYIDTRYILNICKSYSYILKYMSSKYFYVNTLFHNPLHECILEIYFPSICSIFFFFLWGTFHFLLAAFWFPNNVAYSKWNSCTHKMNFFLIFSFTFIWRNILFSNIGQTHCRPWELIKSKTRLVKNDRNLKKLIDSID